MCKLLHCHYEPCTYDESPPQPIQQSFRRALSSYRGVGAMTDPGGRGRGGGARWGTALAGGGGGGSAKIRAASSMWGGKAGGGGPSQATLRTQAAAARLTAPDSTSSKVQPSDDTMARSVDYLDVLGPLRANVEIIKRAKGEILTFKTNLD